MSGCANCVWLDYADEVVDFYCKRGGASDGGVEQILKESLTVARLRTPILAIARLLWEVWFVG